MLPTPTYDSDGAKLKILITGGAGFIGHNLASAALHQGHQVRVLDDMSTGYRDNLSGLNVELVEGSLLDEPLVVASVRGVDAVIHLGALGSVPRSIADPLASHHANSTGTLNVLVAAQRAGVGHVVSASSSSVYGMNPALPKHEREWVRPMSPYAVTKLATEQYTLSFQQSFGLSTLAFRFFNVYGPGQRAGHAYAAVIPTWMDAVRRGEPIWVNGDGSTSRDFTFVSTVCDVLLAATQGRISHPEPVNLAFGTNTSLNDVLQRLERLIGRPLDVRHREPRPGDVPHSQADSSTLASLFPEASAVDIDTGLRLTWEWFEGLEVPNSV